MRIIHNVPTADTLNHEKSSRAHKNGKDLYLRINEGAFTLPFAALNAYEITWTVETPLKVMFQDKEGEETNKEEGKYS